MSPTDIHYTAVADSMLSTKMRRDQTPTTRGMLEHPVLVWSIALVTLLLTVFALVSRANQPTHETAKLYEHPQETRE